ncbi:MAG: stage V sporulation protein AD [Lachnospiraceae bacterium]|nr:stage V sporulation protein AD [Lachnospiraceae bacterium]MBQ9136651.1 stage V sporulation protein AD [Lachnospiraceae bacterium]
MANQLCTVGNQSVRLSKEVYINGNASVVGKKEGEGPLGKLFDMVGEDDMFGCNTWEEAESSLQKDAVYLALGKAKRKPENMRYIFAGDLLGQSIATSFGIMNYGIPLLGVYGACSTCGESLTVGAMAVSGGFAKEVVCVTSSHFASAEKEFRFPLAYGSQRPLSASWTVTGSGAFVLGDEKGENCQAKITGMTVGKIVDFGLKDSLNMGACMAPAAAATIAAHFIDYNSQPMDYDKIITGDLGSVGQRVLLDLLRDKGFDITDRHMDCGMEIYDPKTQDTHAGGSGCGCCAVTLSAYILKQLAEKNWKKVLFVPTGALLSKISFNEGQTVPGIAHGVVLECL